jgi:hypothetical protein
MMARSSSAALAIACFALSITFVASSFITPFAGFDPDQFPVPQNDPPVQPAGYAFAIWGLIYLWLIAGLGWGMIYARNAEDWTAMRRPLAVSLAVGTIWLSVASVSPLWATLFIWVMLASALVALFNAPVTHIAWGALPVGLYAGWLSAASCVSLGLLAAGYGLMSETTAAYTFVTLAILLGAFVQSALRHTPTYGLAIIWALVAVALANIQTQSTIASLSGGGAVAMLFPTLKAFRSSLHLTK